ncbi:DUF6320 domain-containing protein [Atopococcus tabaci]|uniref:DUF6320 domain-containing protein n=1 Tax=Atopococcus tabaci TaxID=269774 RepID=UPI00041817D3|nr:DUF6320 domain-containing protein [Atopococcus tabaci]
MKQCSVCRVQVKGKWETCPLCRAALNRQEKEGSRDPYPEVPLRFNKQRVTRWLMLISLLILAVYFVVDFFFLAQAGIWRLVLFGIMSMWLVMLVILRKKRNIAKGIVYLLVSLSLLMLYLDHSQGQMDWSVSYAIPIICSASLAAMFIALKVVRLSVGDYVLYLLLATLMGFVPAIFLGIGWAENALPSLISISMSCAMLVYVLLRHGREIQNQLIKRLDV